MLRFSVFSRAIVASFRKNRDYGHYVAEALRVIGGTSSDKVIFKDGTSLAKGWNLIERFSVGHRSSSIPEHFNHPGKETLLTAS